MCLRRRRVAGLIRILFAAAPLIGRLFRRRMPSGQRELQVQAFKSGARHSPGAQSRRKIPLLAFQALSRLYRAYNLYLNGRWRGRCSSSRASGYCSGRQSAGKGRPSCRCTNVGELISGAAVHDETARKRHYLNSSNRVPVLVLRVLFL